MRYIIIILSVILFQSLKASELAIDNHLSKVIWRANKSTGSFHNGFIELADGHITIENNKVINDHFWSLKFTGGLGPGKVL